jgi:3-oxoacyl-[acyl-carrier-protein] synthase-3
MAYLNSNIGVAFGSLKVNNDFFKDESSKISSKIGIDQRFWVENEDAVDLAELACVDLLNKVNITKESIDFIILVTSSPRYVLPTSACILQSKLGLATSCGAIDVNLGCSGYPYALGLAKALITSGQCKNVIVITSDTYSKYVDKFDYRTSSIFGDAATASWISESSQQFELRDVKYFTDGSGYDKLIKREGEDLFMSGKDIFNFTCNTVVQSLKDFLPDKSDYLIIPHQANNYMLKTMAKLLDLSEEKFIINMNKVGNTVSSSIPIALSNTNTSRVKEIVLAGFGVGLSWSFIKLRNI